jgi:hypothetical protein
VSREAGLRKFRSKIAGQSTRTFKVALEMNSLEGARWRSKMLLIRSWQQWSRPASSEFFGIVGDSLNGLTEAVPGYDRMGGCPK